MGVDGGTENSAVPSSVMDAVNRTLATVEQLKLQCIELSSLSHPDVLANMPPLQRAETLLLLAKVNTSFYALRLKCNGINPDEHRIKSEFERLTLYEDKVRRFADSINGPARPSASLNTQAATRFIEHSLPDLTEEQRQRMRYISKREGNKIKYVDTSRKKRKQPEKKSAQMAAKEFLEKAAQELNGDNNNNNSGFKGPLRVNNSEDEE